MEKIKQIFCADKDFCALVAKQNKQNKWEFWGYSGKDERGMPKYGFRLLSNKLSKHTFDAVDAKDTTTGRTTIKVLQSEKWHEIVFIQTPKVECNDYPQCWEWAIGQPMRMVYVQANEDENLESLLKRGAGIKSILIDLALTTTFGITENSSKNVILLMEYFLKNGIDVNEKDEWGDTALHHACRGGNTNIVKLLLENGADVNLKNKKHHTAWFYASNRENTDTLKLMLNYCNTCNETSSVVITALKEACINSDVELVKLLLDYGVDASPLRYSIKDLDWEDWKYQMQILKLLANKNIDVDAADDLGMTNLMNICSVKWYDFEKAWGGFDDFLNDQQEIIQLLLGKGADINAQCHNGKTALHYAIDYTQYQGNIRKKHPYLLAKLLLKKGANINATDNHNTTALMLANVSDLQLAAKHLFRQGIDIHIKDHIGRTASTLARQWQSENIYELLRKREEKEQTIPKFSELINNSQLLLPLPELESLLGLLKLPCSFTTLLAQCRSYHIPKMLVEELAMYFQYKKCEIDPTAMEKFKNDRYNKFN